MRNMDELAIKRHFDKILLKQKVGFLRFRGSRQSSRGMARKGPFICDHHDCGKEYDRPAKLTEHKLSHSNEV